MTKKALTLIVSGVCLVAAASGATIYGAGENGDLYTINPTTGVTSAGLAMGVTMTDIAEYNGALYGISGVAGGISSLYTINPTTGATHDQGSTGISLVALTFNASGVLYAAGAGTTNIYTLTLATGAATQATTPGNGSNDNAAGDLEFFGGLLYLTVGGDGTNAPSTLDTVNTTTGALHVVGAIGFNDVFGLATAGGVLYGFTDPAVTGGGTNSVITINTTTGAGTSVATYGTVGFYGSTDDAVPEPGTLGVMALGLIGLGSVALRRRKA